MIGLLKEIWLVLTEMSPYILLGIFFVAILDLFVSKKVILNHVSKNNIGSIIKTAIFGVPLPLCSCGVIPTSVYLEKNGASKPAVVSFLISTPQTGIDSIIATYGMLGSIFALFRPIAAFVMGIIGGVVTLFVQKNDKKGTAPSSQLDFAEIDYDENKEKFSQKVLKSFRYAFVDFIDDISAQFLIGLLIAGAISFFVPDDFFSSFFQGNEFLAILSVILFSIPMYVCATASIPIALTLMMKGFSPAVAYVFLVTGPVTNAASLSILSKVLGKKLLIVYVLVVIILSIIFGQLLNWIFTTTGIDPHSQMKHISAHIHNTNFTPIDYLITYFFIILLISSFIRKLNDKIKGEKMTSRTNAIGVYKVEGMTCNHCVMNVEKSIRSVAGVKNVEVNLSSGLVKIEGDYKVEDIRNAIESIGYKFVGE